MELKIISIVGARPQFIKIAPLIRSINRKNSSGSRLKLKHVIVHTGQHYDYKMNKIFFDELNIPEPDYNLGVGSNSHGHQTGEMMIRAEKVLMEEKPEYVLVYGDTNSTLSGALAAAKLLIPVAHVEAGVRSYNKEMPEEINRILTDHCSSFLFCPTRNAVRNLKKEGFTNTVEKGELTDLSSPISSLNNPLLPLVINVGDIMYDALLMSQEIAAKRSDALERYGLKPKEYGLATIHRAENTDNPKKMKSIFAALDVISKKHLRILVPLHPRARKKIKESILEFGSILFIDPVSYLDMLILEKAAKVILTDSGGVQKEAFFLEVPCITLRNETEWVETVESGWNILAGHSRRIILNAFKTEGSKSYSPRFTTLFGDGHAGERIIDFFTN